MASCCYSEKRKETRRIDLSELTRNIELTYDEVIIYYDLFGEITPTCMYLYTYIYIYVEYSMNMLSLKE